MKLNYNIVMILWYLLIANTTFAYTRQDTLRGSNGDGRKWWDVQHYDLSVSFKLIDSSIAGSNIISYKIVDAPSNLMQIDLQEPMLMDSVLYKGEKLSFYREGNVWWVSGRFSNLQKGVLETIEIYYHGVPRKAKLPPWDGGLIWANDSTGKPWIAVACQGLGASSWWPCKDYQADEPDNGMDFVYTFSDKGEVIGNGEPMAVPVTNSNSHNNLWGWKVTNPINTYSATFYIGDYVSWEDTLMGEKGKLNLSFYPLRHNEAIARKQFAVTKQMLHCFEYWMGPYPFYEDGYKLVEAPFLGMEHQSAVAYGNQYKMGYLGADRSGTGVGTLFDFIIIHETGHEWFGNNITAADVADNWLHEGFTTYTEALFTECAFGKEKAYAYTRGEWKNIRNDVPVTGDYGVQDDGSSDKYDKGSAVVHMIRVLMNNDEKFRQLLRGLNKEFYHQVVTGKQVEAYIIKFTGLNLKPIFDQYLRTTQIPKFEWYIKKHQLYYRFINVVDGFSLQLPVSTSRKNEVLNVTAEWQSILWKKGGYNLDISADFLLKQ